MLDKITIVLLCNQLIVCEAKLCKGKLQRLM